MLSNKAKTHLIFTNPTTGHTVEFTEGFNWLAFIFSPLYYWYKGMIYRGVELILLNFVLSAIFSVFKISFVGTLLVMLCSGFLFDTSYKEYLIARGYKPSNDNLES